jgi:SnoaL-like domain
MIGDIKAVHKVLESHLQAVATKNVPLLRAVFHQDGVFVGSDDTELWTADTLIEKLQDSANGWDMRKCHKRQIHFVDGSTAMFFEVIEHVRYGTFRGSGVVIRNRTGDWLIRHYVLSFSVPNSLADKPIFLKALARAQQQETN